MDDNKRHLTKDEILKVARDSLNKTLGELGIDKYKASGTNKGGVGQFVEEVLYGYKANGESEPDFIDAGIELKVTPVQKNKNGTWSSKERLVLNMIDYFDEAKATFETSSFYKKNKTLLIWFYHHMQGRPETDFEITAYDIYEFEKSLEFKVIKRDWEIIHSKIVNGLAHEISESDTTFLAACTKGAGHGQTRKQPYSPLLAKPRAYSFKTGFMTRLYREVIHKMATEAPYLVSDDEWMKNPLEEIYKEKFSVFHGMSVQELRHKYMYYAKPKDYLRRITQRMLGFPGDQMQTQEMADAGIIFKTVRLNKSGMPHESMSFPSIDFSELVKTSWEDSDIRDLFCDLKIMLVIFRDDSDGTIRFDKVLFWNVPNSIVDGPIRKMYENSVEMLRKGEAFEFDEKGEVRDRFPKEGKRSNGVCHMRPHGRVGVDTMPLPVKDKETGITEYVKTAFWFNKKFVAKTIKELEDAE